MREVKDTQRAIVRIGYDGRVHKWYKGLMAKERFENEVRMLRILEDNQCPFTPRLLSENEEELYIVTTNCGSLATKISDERAQQLFEELERYGVKHDDPFPRNITYDALRGFFCVIDFEFATSVETGEGLTLKEAEDAKEKARAERTL